MNARDRAVVIVGGGKMGEAILSGWLSSADCAQAGISAASTTVVNPGLEKRERLAARYGVTCVADVADVEAADLVVLAVKPQVMMTVLEGICANPAFGGGAAGPLFVSIAAGLDTGRISQALPEGARLVRVMPNTPLLVGKGASAACAAAGTPEDDLHDVLTLFGCLGVAHAVDESALDAVCAVSGSGPAYVAAMVEAMRDAGVRQGLDHDVAESLALQTVLGTAQLIEETGVTPEQARLAVCSPGGTTLAALDAMNGMGFAQVIDAGVAAAVKRSKELAQC